MLFDSHIHLDECAQLAQALQRARAQGVGGWLTMGTHPAQWAQLPQLAEHEGVHLAFGVHPLWAGAVALSAQTQATLREALEHPAVRAVGEIGLDFHRADSGIALQKSWMQYQCELACERDLPVCLHARKSLDQVLMLVRKTACRGVLHAFSGSQVQADRAQELGLYLGVGGMISYPRAQRLRRIIAAVPAECLLLETDAPYQPLSGYQGLANAPHRLAEVVQTLAALRAEPVAQLAQVLAQNARRLFGVNVAPDVEKLLLAQGIGE